MAPPRDCCAVYLGQLVLVVYARYVDDLFSLDEVEQPELALEFIGPTGTATLALRVIQVLLGWELDAGRAVTNANVFVALGVEVGYVDVSETMFFALRRNEQPSGGSRSKVPCCHIAFCRLRPGSSRGSSIGVPRTCLAVERGCTSPRCSIMPLVRVDVFPSACRRLLNDGSVSWRAYLFVEFLRLQCR